MSTARDTLTVYKVLSAATSNNMEDLKAEALIEYYKAISVFDRENFKVGTQMKSAKQIRQYWKQRYDNETLYHNHPFLNKDHYLNKDPRKLILQTSLNSHIFECLKAYGLGSAYTKEVEKEPDTSKAGPSKPVNTISKKNSSGTTTPDAEEISGKYQIGKSIDNTSTKIQKLLDAMKEDLQNEIDEMAGKIETNETDIQNNLATANEANRIANENANDIRRIEETTNHNAELIGDANTRINSHENRLVTLTNIANGMVAPPASASVYIIIQNYQASRLARAMYRKIINDLRNNGWMTLDVITGKEDIYLIDHENEDVDTEANVASIQNKLSQDETGEVKSALKVYIKNCSVVKRKNNKFTVFFQIDATNILKPKLVNRLISTRGRNSGHFGLKTNVPSIYNIDVWLGFAKQHFIEAGTGRPLIHSFDTNKAGFYVIFLNDASRNGWNEGDTEMFEGRERTVKEKDKCTRIMPGCPKQFMNIKESEFTYENLKKLEDKENYFVWDGYIWKKPSDEDMKRAGVVERIGR